jgi:hypothetical protein
MARSGRVAILVITFALIAVWKPAGAELLSKAASTNAAMVGQLRTGQPPRVSVSPTPSREPTPTAQLPSISYFSCDPCVLEPGEATTLRWDLSGATAAYLDGEGVAAPGSTVVAPDQTTTYRLEAVAERGSVERLVTVTVKEGSDPDTISELLHRSGYDVRWVGYLPLAGGGDTISIIMAAISETLHSQEIASQYYEGFKVLFDAYPAGVLTVGLYDGKRYMLFASVDSEAFEAFLRGEMDGWGFWQATIWNVWDEWTSRWLEDSSLRMGHKDFVTKDFGR